MASFLNADDTTAYSYINMYDGSNKVKMPRALEKELQSVVN